MPKRTYNEAFSLVSPSPTPSAPVITTKSTASLPLDSPTGRRVIALKTKYTPNELAGTFAPSSQPVGFTQRALQTLLTGEVVFANDAIVNSVFQPSKVDDKTVTDILAEIDVDKSLKTALDSVLSRKLGKRIRNKSILVLFEHITTYNHEDIPLMNNDYARHVRRAWVDTHRQSIRTDPEIYLPGEVEGEDEDSNDDDNSENEVELDNRHPDLTLIDFPVGERVILHPYGRHSCLYVEVKVDANEKPNLQQVILETPGKGSVEGADGTPTVKSILRQIADVARLHLSTRPFMRYSLHITLCGTIFNICLFDRAGGIVSKDYHLNDKADFEVFVRVIRRATCEMSAYELGLDPTVIPLDYLGSVARYPRFKVEVGDKHYYTHGFPIWQSTTLQGRGTWVFGATKDNNPNPSPDECFVLKNAWRAPGRLPESTLYAIINKLQGGDDRLPLRCVAEFVDGGDVMVEEEALPTSSSKSTDMQRAAMRVSTHRKFAHDAEPNSIDPILHRVILATRGRSMVSYTSLVELLRAAECAAEGLMALHQRGVSHRDVSIGDVLLGTDASKPAGFIADLDLSSIGNEAIKEAYPTGHEAIISKLKVREWGTGTALFMSLDLLSALESYSNASMTGRPRDFAFQHQLCHDFESLIWVIVYAMMIRRRTILVATNPSIYTQYKEHLDGFWGVHSYTNLVNCHEAIISAGARRSRTIVEELLFPHPLEAEFFRAAMRLLRSQGDDENPITYEKLQGLFRTYIQRAEQASPPTPALA